MRTANVPGTRGSGTTARAQRLAGLLMVLTGLFAMHGLSTHGTSTTHPAAHGSPESSITASPTPFDAHDASLIPRVVAGHGSLTGHSMAEHLRQVTVSAVAAQVAVAAAAPWPADDDAITMATLCLVVLALTTFALVMRLHARRRGELVASPARDRVAPRPRGRDPDPPSLLFLSIQRC